MFQSNISVQRSKRLKRNIIYSLCLAGLSMAISFVLYPLLIDLLGVEVYGTWLTIASISNWMIFFEFGLGSGLKNQLGRAISNRNYDKGKELVSTTYIVISIIVIILFGCFLLARNNIDWQILLNSKISNDILATFATIMISGFLVIFILKLLGNVASAFQDPFIEKVISVSISFAALLTVLFLAWLNVKTLTTLSLWWTIASIAVWILFSVILYRTRYRVVSPDPKLFRKKHLRSLLNLGIQFFIIQISLVVINGTTNFIISHYIGASDVVIYNATYKLFSCAHILYTIIIAPTWPAFIDAIEQKDIFWIKNIIRRMLRIWLYITSFMFLVLLSSPLIFNVWLGDKVSIPFMLSVLLFMYFTGMTFGGIFNMYVNARGKLKLQMVCWIVLTALYIPMTILLIEKTQLGIFSIAIGLLLTNVYYVIVAPLQYKKLITQ